MHDYCGLSACKGTVESQPIHLSFSLKNAVVTSETFSLSIGDPYRIVEIGLDVEVSGPDDCDNGFFINGRSFFPDMPHILAWGHPLL